jgi:hypothetical protein
MKKSTIVTMVLSSTLAGGCDDRGAPGDWSAESAANTVTNNTYVPGRGYYHAPCNGWFPYPYNYYSPGLGYYHGGVYTPDPASDPVISSRPTAPGGGSRVRSGTSDPVVTRGGFGSSGHARS